MLKFLRKLDPLVHIALIIAISSLFYLAFSQRQQIADLTKKISTKPSQTIIRTETSQEGLTEGQIREIVDGTLALITPAEGTTINQTVATKTTNTQTTYIPLGSTYTSTDQGWFTLEDTATTVSVGDYGEDPYIDWEASLKVAHANGKASVRIWDDTNKVAVVGSELSTTDNADYKKVSSGRIYLWSGNNTYKVQLKSLNGFEVAYSGGKIKIVY